MINIILALRNFVGVLDRLCKISLKTEKKGTVSYEEMLAVVGTLKVGYEQAFILPDGSKINLGSKEDIY